MPPARRLTPLRRNPKGHRLGRGWRWRLTTEAPVLTDHVTHQLSQVGEAEVSRGRDASAKSWRNALRKQTNSNLNFPSSVRTGSSTLVSCLGVVSSRETCHSLHDREMSLSQTRQAGGFIVSLEAPGTLTDLAR